MNHRIPADSTIARPRVTVHGTEVTCVECCWCGSRPMRGAALVDGEPLVILSCVHKSHPIAVLPPGHGCRSFLHRDWAPMFDEASRITAYADRLAPECRDSVPRCECCGCLVTDHVVDDEERRECIRCACPQFVRALSDIP